MKDEWNSDSEGVLKSFNKAVEDMRSNIKPDEVVLPVEKSLTIFQQDLPNHEDKRLELINNAMNDYSEANKIPLPEMQRDTKTGHTPTSMRVSFKEDLIIEVKNGYSFKKGVFTINYSVHESIDKAENQ